MRPLLSKYSLSKHRVILGCRMHLCLNYDRRGNRLALKGIIQNKKQCACKCQILSAFENHFKNLSTNVKSKILYNDCHLKYATPHSSCVLFTLKSLSFGYLIRKVFEDGQPVSTSLKCFRKVMKISDHKSLLGELNLPANNQWAKLTD